MWHNRESMLPVHNRELAKCICCIAGEKTGFMDNCSARRGRQNIWALCNEIKAGKFESWAIWVSKLFVEWGSTNTGWHINVHHVNNFAMEHLWVNGWGIYGLKLVGQLWLKCVAQLCLFWKYAQKVLVFRGVPFLVIAWPQVWTADLWQRRWDHSPPKACFHLRRSPALCLLWVKQNGVEAQWVEL